MTRGAPTAPPAVTDGEISKLLLALRTNRTTGLTRHELDQLFDGDNRRARRAIEVARAHALAPIVSSVTRLDGGTVYRLPVSPAEFYEWRRTQLHRLTSIQTSLTGAERAFERGTIRIPQASLFDDPEPPEPEEINPRDLLGVSATATREEIDTAYQRRLDLLNHATTDLTRAYQSLNGTP